MKILLNIYLMLILSSSLFAQQMRVKININTPHPFVIMDDSLKYYGNNFEINLSEGKHYLNIYEDQLKWSGGFLIDTINVNPGKIHSVKLGNIEPSSSIFELNYKFDIEDKAPLTAPKESMLSKKNLLGNMPLIISENPDTSRGITYSRIFKFKGKRIPQKISVGKISFNHSGQEKHFSESKWFPLLIGSAVIFGGVSAYLKNQADKKYEDYLTSNNRNLLDETNRLDLTSGIALGAMELNIGYIIYKLLSE